MVCSVCFRSGPVPSPATLPPATLKPLVLILGESAPTLPLSWSIMLERYTDYFVSPFQQDDTATVVLSWASLNGPCPLSLWPLSWRSLSMLQADTHGNLNASVVRSSSLKACSISLHVRVVLSHDADTFGLKERVNQIQFV
jgi:hypothetical protein